MVWKKKKKENVDPGHQHDAVNCGKNKPAGFCVNCGSKLESGWKFCKYCGFAVRSYRTDDGEIPARHVIEICPVCGKEITDRDIMRVYFDGPNGWYEEYSFQCSKCGKIIICVLLIFESIALAVLLS